MCVYIRVCVYTYVSMWTADRFGPDDVDRHDVRREKPPRKRQKSQQCRSIIIKYKQQTIYVQAVEY